jgi:protein-tyrosine phosphatase
VGQATTAVGRNTWISGRSDLGWDDSVGMGLRYVGGRSLTSDLLILWNTGVAVIRGWQAPPPSCSRRSCCWLAAGEATRRRRPRDSTRTARESSSATWSVWGARRSPAAYGDEVRLLFVCTGNLCRSPVAERLAVAWAGEALGPGARKLQIMSAGVRATAGQPMDERSALALLELGGDPVDFRSQPLTTVLARDADLILTMTRDHRRLVLEQAPLGLRRTFALLEATALLRRLDRRGLPDLPLPERARELGLRLDRGRALRMSTKLDDIPDPIGRRSSVHQQVAAQIASAFQPLAAVLFNVPESRLAGQAPPPRSVTA